MSLKNKFFGSETGPSPAGTLNITDWKKIGKGALFAAGGAVVTFLLSLLPGLDLGKYTVIIMPIATVLLNAAAKYFNGGQ